MSVMNIAYAVPTAQPRQLNLEDVYDHASKLLDELNDLRAQAEQLESALVGATRADGSGEPTPTPSGLVNQLNQRLTQMGAQIDQMRRALTIASDAVRPVNVRVGKAELDPRQFNIAGRGR